MEKIVTSWSLHVQMCNVQPEEKNQLESADDSKKCKWKFIKF